MHRVYPPKLFMAGDPSKSNTSNTAWGGSVGGPTHYECCFITTFETISLSELTIAAQVSSAEDSRARTVKQRIFRRARRRGREGLMTRRSMTVDVIEQSEEGEHHKISRYTIILISNREYANLRVTGPQ